MNVIYIVVLLLLLYFQGQLIFEKALLALALILSCNQISHRRNITVVLLVSIFLFDVVLICHGFDLLLLLLIFLQSLSIDYIDIFRGIDFFKIDELKVVCTFLVEITNVS